MFFKIFQRKGFGYEMKIGICLYLLNKDFARVPGHEKCFGARADMSNCIGEFLAIHAHDGDVIDLAEVEQHRGTGRA